MKHTHIASWIQRHKRALFLSVAVLGVAAVFSYLTWSGYREALAGAETTSRNYAAIIEARLDATLRRADTHLTILQREIPLEALSQQAVHRYAKQIDRALDSRSLNFPEVAAMRIYGAEGQLLYSSNSKGSARTNIVGRDIYDLARKGSMKDPLFSEVIVGRALKRPIMAMSRSFRYDQGAFRGIVIIAIDLEYFESLFSLLDVGPGGVVAVYRRDNFKMVMHRKPGKGKVNKPLPPGSAAKEIGEA